MSFVKISDLPAATQANATDQLETNQGGTSRRVTVQQVAAHVAANLPGATVNGTAVISANSASDALRITQTGSGNALVVEDSANPDATPFVVDAAGRVGIGAAPLYAVDGLSIASAASFAPQVFVRNSANDGAASYLNFEKVRSAAIVQNGDDLGVLAFRGFDGVQQINAAFILSEVDGTPGTNDMPGRLVFSTTADGASSPTERMRIASTGNVGIGLTAPSYSLHVNGRIAAQTPTSDWALLNNASGGAVRGGLWVTSGGDVGVSNATVANGWFAGSSNAYAVTNFSERMRIDASGNVGIGTTAATARLTTRLSAGTQSPSALWRGAILGADYTRSDNSDFVSRQIAVGATQYVTFLQAEDPVLNAMPLAINPNGGNVGIGTSSPAARVDVVGPALTLATPSTYAMWIANSGGANGDLALASNASAAYIQSFNGKPLVLNSQGNNVGIGTSAPGARLDVVGGDIRLANNRGLTFRNFAGTNVATFILQVDDNFVVYNAAGAPVQSFSQAAAPVAVYGADGNHRMSVNASTGTIAWATAGLERMRVDTNGRVGIGTAGNGFHRLAVREDTNAGATALFSSSSNTAFPGLTFERTRAASTAVQSGDTLGVIQFAGFDGSTGSGRSDIISLVDGATSTGSVPTRMTFSTTPSGSLLPVERMRITSAGNVGIGTSVPGSPLTIANASADPLIALNATGTQNNAVQWLRNGVTHGAIYQENAGAFHVRNFTAQPAIFWTNNTERMRITADGNVLIGTTGSFADAMLTVRGSAAATRRIIVENNSTAVGTAARYDLVTGTGNSYALWTLFEDGAGNATFDLGCGPAVTNGIFMSSGTSTAPIVFRQQTSERMRIASTGEVYIAGTTDQGAFNLQVNGTGVWGAGAYVNGSDARIKDDIAPLASGLDVVAKLKPVQFRYKESWAKDTSLQPGFIAQDLQEALGDQPYVDGVVLQGPEYMSVAYQSLIPLLTKAIQEQQSQIETLKARVAALENN